MTEQSGYTPSDKHQPHENPSVIEGKVVPKKTTKEEPAEFMAWLNQTTDRNPGFATELSSYPESTDRGRLFRSYLKALHRTETTKGAWADLYMAFRNHLQLIIQDRETKGPFFTPVAHQPQRGRAETLYATLDSLSRVHSRGEDKNFEDLLNKCNFVLFPGVSFYDMIQMAFPEKNMSLIMVRPKPIT